MSVVGQLSLRNIAKSLLIVGHAITDKELILYILGNLEHEYVYVMVNLTSRQDALTLQEVEFIYIFFERGRGPREDFIDEYQVIQTRTKRGVGIQPKYDQSQKILRKR